MRCPECKRKSAGPQCSCGYQFIFDPENSRGLTDAGFREAVRLAGAGGRFCFTRNQLYAAYCLLESRRRRMRRKSAAAAGIIPALALVLSLAGLLAVPFWAPLLLLAAAGAYPFVGKGGVRWSRDEFDRVIDRWLKTAPLEDLVDEPAGGPPASPESDDPVDRILVVERDMLLALLVRNQVHSTERCRIVSMSAESRGAQAGEANPGGLPVFFLHDEYPDEEGGAAAERAARLVGASKAVDLGLSPDFIDQRRELRSLPRDAWGGRLPADAVLPLALGQLLSESMTLGVSFADLRMGRGSASDSDAGPVLSDTTTFESK